jgi:general secretion pathway protein B
MSLILEALRKSEAERRRGQAPDLRTELPPVAPPRPHALPRWSWAVLALTLLALAWLLLARPWSAPANDGLPPPADATAQVGDVAADAIPDTGSRLPERRIVIDPAVAVPPAESASASRPGSAEPIASPATAVASGPGTRSPPADGTVTGAGTTASTPIDANRGNAPPAPAVPVEPSSAPPTPVATAQPLASPLGTRLLALSDLSAEERRQLPPLKLSMHMWSEDPARRFVILDGQRLAEGDRAGPAVVDAIRSDDVVLAWNGMRLRLSLR